MGKYRQIYLGRGQGFHINTEKISWMPFIAKISSMTRKDSPWVTVIEPFMVRKFDLPGPEEALAQYIIRSPYSLQMVQTCE